MKDQDKIIRFIFEHLGIRGEWVKLTKSWRSVIANQVYSASVQQQLGQACAASVLLAATIKFKGSLILQSQGQELFSTLVAQCSHDYYIRGLARNSAPVEAGNMHTVYGKDRLVITIEPENTQPYQGIVELGGDNLSQALEKYYTQSEQLKTRIWLFANGNQVAGLLLQELPDKQSNVADWKRIEVLADTLTEQEILELSCHKMLYRLFNEEVVRVFDPESVHFRCSCSVTKIENTLTCLGRETLQELLQENNEITVDCEFCSQKYSFDAIDVRSILARPLVANTLQTRH